MAVTADKPAPYAPASVILDIIDRYRNRGLPSPINGEILARAGVSESLIPRALQALQSLDLVGEEGQPTQHLEDLRLAAENEYKERFETWLRSAYADVMNFVDPSEDDETKVRDAFRSYKPVGQQGRMVTLFLGLCASAGLIPEKPTQPRRTSTPRASKPRSPSSTKARPKAGSSHGVPEPIAAMLSQLPPEGDGWTKDRRDQFLQTFGSVLDFCIPMIEAAPISSPTVNDEGYDQYETADDD